MFAHGYYSCFYTIHHHHHYHHVTPSAWISLTLSRHLSLSSIASGRSSELYPISTESCCMLVWAGRLAFAQPCEGFHKSSSLMSSSLLLQLCPACLVRLILIVFVMGGRWPYSYCFVGCYLQDLFNIARRKFYLILIIFLQTVEWLQVLLFNTNYSVQHYSFVFKQLNSSKYWSVIPVMHAGKWF